MAFLEEYSLLPQLRRFDEKPFPCGDSDDLEDPEQMRTRVQRSSILRTVHFIYTVVLTFVLAIVAVQGVFRDWSDKSEPPTPQRENPFPRSTTLAIFRVHRSIANPSLTLQYR